MKRPSVRGYINLRGLHCTHGVKGGRRDFNLFVCLKPLLHVDPAVMGKLELPILWLAQLQGFGSNNFADSKVYDMQYLRASKHHQPAFTELSCGLPYDSQQDSTQIFPHGGVSRTILWRELHKSFLRWSHMKQPLFWPFMRASMDTSGPLRLGTFVNAPLA